MIEQRKWGIVESSLDMNAVTVRERLGLGEDATAGLDDLESVGAPRQPVRLPSRDEAVALLARLAVPSADVPELVSAMPSAGDDPALWWLLERCYHRLVQDMGGFGPLRPWASLPASLGAAGRYFYAYVFLAALPDVRRWHQERGIPDDVSWATLADLGQNMAIYRRMHGDGGVGAHNWLTLHFRGAIYWLGRLQFNRSRIRFDAATLERLGVGFHHGDPAIGVHIPETGPMSPDACDASFRWARDFFGRYFPEDRVRIATCGSWLLDEQLAEYLPADSNIIRFQRRFHLAPGGFPADQEIVRFVFRRTAAELDELPQRTTLERAIVQHLRAGRHWEGRSGWLEL